MFDSYTFDGAGSTWDGSGLTIAPLIIACIRATIPTPVSLTATIPLVIAIAAEIEDC